MKKVIIIKYGELSTKKANINFFLKKLNSNILNALKDLDCDIKYDKGRMFIVPSDFDEAIIKLNKIFGIHEICVGYLLDNTNLDILKDELIDKLKDISFKTFKVETKRSDKNYFMDSMEISRSVGSHVLKNISNISVDVRQPEVLINVEVRNKELVFYFEKIKGIGGYPVGTQGKSMLMLSGGIDSPVAGYLAIKRGISLDCIYFDSPPHTSQKAMDKVISLAKELKEYDPKIRVFIINFTKMQETILKTVPHDYLITIMRRMMYRIAERLANSNKCHTIINGESIGQVASQTLTSMKCINEVIKMPVIRPVACLDKLEIIDIAKKIGTYETSILPFEDCCTIFVPKHPVINPESNICEKYEELFDYNSLIDEIMENIVCNKLKDEESFEDLL